MKLAAHGHEGTDSATGRGRPRLRGNCYRLAPARGYFTRGRVNGTGFLHQAVDVSSLNLPGRFAARVFLPILVRRQCERGCIIAGPHLKCQTLKRIRQDKLEQSHSFKASSCGFVDSDTQPRGPLHDVPEIRAFGAADDC